MLAVRFVVVKLVTGTIDCVVIVLTIIQLHGIMGIDILFTVTMKSKVFFQSLVFI